MKTKNLCTYIYIYIHVYECIYIYMYMYVYTSRAMYVGGSGFAYNFCMCIHCTLVYYESIKSRENGSPLHIPSQQKKSGAVCP